LTIHLRATAGEYELLLESESVRGVSAAGEAAGDVAAQAGRGLPLLDLALTLGGAPARPDGAIILYAAGEGGEGAITLAVDEVKGLVTLGPDALARLPPISARFAQLFDAIAVEPIEGSHPLRLRARLDLQAIGREDA
jgi:chemotaxis signal transduction protein